MANVFDQPIYLANEQIVDNLFDDIHKPGFKDKRGGLFSYEDGAFVTNSPISRANGFYDPDQLARALDYANNSEIAKAYNPNSRMVPVHMQICFKQVPVDADEIVRQSALAKLSDREKVALGLNDD